MVKFIALLLMAGLTLNVHAASVKVFAAASLSPALQQIIERYEQLHDDDIVLVSGASSALARQVSQGAPADIYVSANQAWMQYVLDNTAINTAKSQPWLGNQLVLVASGPQQGFDVTSVQAWQAALQQDYLAMADSRHVPAGIYGKQALSALGVWSELAHKIAASNNVRAALALVERGAAPLAVVYQTDAEASAKVHTLAVFPKDSHDPIIYPALLLSETRASARFYDFLWSQQALATLSQHSFEVFPRVN
ncbi:molybdate ABC transporter substrate-binding protein [Motilimonas pumila]|uniref:Molybdate ABC transporter substrate-binding protein n=1 Tax=Motilimonas pumila TaxID=2303987 RepID=A0A418YIE1_9GAMM|nr:molybdate ABC transporter substrate-binding protein [Motilimonas pumila]RJG50421.1 molybdate ABC transporter substrate-binding protein [Motilimonas pumila]